ncbi:hypothetical protein AMTRI_Chr01g110840 [Amborella trichopoda]
MVVTCNLSSPLLPPFSFFNSSLQHFSRQSQNLSLFSLFNSPGHLLQPKPSKHLRATSSKALSVAMDSKETSKESEQDSRMKLLFVEMGVGYDQHGQDITAAAMRACRDAISSNSIPALRLGSVPGVTFDQMKLKIKLGVPRSTQQSLDVEKVKSVFPYGNIVSCEVVDGGLICSSGVCLEAIGDKNDDCYIVNAAVYVGY